MEHKILGLIPSRARGTAPIVAKKMLPFCETIVIYGRDVPYSDRNLPDRVYLMDQPEEWGLNGVRNKMTELFMNSHADVMLQVDDDLDFPSTMIPNILSTLFAYVSVGAAAGQSRVIHHWNEDIKSNGPYRLDGLVSQMFAVKKTAVNDMMGAYDDGPFGPNNVLEDLLFSVRMWTQGWALLRVHLPDVYVTPTISRLNKSVGSGGQPVSEREAGMDEAIAFMSDEVAGPDGVLKFIRPKYLQKSKQKSFNVRYNYINMVRNVKARWGFQGYTDNKGRSF
jgi:hypothetical protein